MPRLVSSAALAIALLGGEAMALIARATRPLPADARLGSRAVAPSPQAPAGAASEATAPPPVAAVAAPVPTAVWVAAPRGAGSPSPATGPSKTSVAAASAARRPSRTVRRLLRARQVKEQLAARRSDAPPPGPQVGAHGLPPEERAAMEGAGPDEDGAAPADEGR